MFMFTQSRFLHSLAICLTRSSSFRKDCTIVSASELLSLFLSEELPVKTTPERLTNPLIEGRYSEGKGLVE